MQTYMILGRYSMEAIKEMSVERTKKAINFIGELGGKVHSIYALLGGYDLVLIVDLPTIEKAMQASLGLSLLTSISFTSFPAISVEEFDKKIVK